LEINNQPEKIQKRKKSGSIKQGPSYKTSSLFPTH